MSDYIPEFKVGDLVIKAGECIAELEAQLAEARAEVESYQAKLVEEQERNLNNVANAQLQIEEITADRDVWRAACFRARESGVRALMEIERLEDAR